MAGGSALKCDLGQAWDAAVQVTSATYGLEPALLTAESRGRGARPPARVWEAKKLAVYLAVAVSNCDYAALGRRLGLHRDTVTSHCAFVRELCADDADFEARAEALVELANHRLGREAPARPVPGPQDIDLWAAYQALDARLARIEGMLRRALAHPTVSDEAELHPTVPADHGTVIKFPGTAELPA